MFVQTYLRRQNMLFDSRHTSVPMAVTSGIWSLVNALHLLLSVITGTVDCVCAYADSKTHTRSYSSYLRHLITSERSSLPLVSDHRNSWLRVCVCLCVRVNSYTCQLLWSHTYFTYAYSQKPSRWCLTTKLSINLLPECIQALGDCHVNYTSQLRLKPSCL